MPGPILCAVADAEADRRPVAVAAALAERLGAPLELVHAVEPVAPLVPPGTPGVAAAGMAAALPDVEELAHRRRAVLEPLAPEGAAIALLDGPAVAAITRHATEREAQLVVAGSAGRGALASAVLGSVSSGLVRDSPCPVVVVGPRARDAAPADR